MSQTSTHPSIIRMPNAAEQKSELLVGTDSGHVEKALQVGQQCITLEDLVFQETDRIEGLAVAIEETESDSNEISLSP